MGIVSDWPNRDAETTIALLAEANHVREGKMLLAAKLDKSEGNGRFSKTPKKNAKPKRGRRADTDPEADRNVADAWGTHHYRTYADLERELNMKKRRRETRS